MLTSAADYVYNAGNLGDCPIQGRIIPTEDINGQPHPLRRENFAYLSEAVSERQGSAWWSCPAQHAPVLSSHIGGVGAKIKSLYPASAGQWMKPEASAYARAFGSDATAYAANALTSADCTIPASVGNALSAVYFRHCFYNINRLRSVFWTPTGTPGTHGGSVSVSATNKYGSASATANCDGSQFRQLGDSNGTGITVTVNMPTSQGTPNPTPFTGGVYDFNDLSSQLFDTGAAAYERAYGGILYIGLSAKPTYGDPRLFLVWRVIETYASGATTHSIIDPVSSVTAENAEGFPFVFGFRSLSQSYFRGLVSFAVPSASFSQTGTWLRSYSVTFGGFAVLADMPYKSLLPSGWTWTPT